MFNLIIMIEIDCMPLSGRGKPIHATIHEGEFCNIKWGKTSFSFPYSFLNEILKNYFVDRKWYPLGGNFTPPWKGLGEYIIKNQKYFSPSPKYASAIASIMFQLDLIDFREVSTPRYSIELRKR